MVLKPSIDSGSSPRFVCALPAASPSMFTLHSQGHRLIANVDQREGQLLHLRLIDPQDPNSATDPMACLNADLVREGEASSDQPGHV